MTRIVWTVIGIFLIIASFWGGSLALFATSAGPGDGQPVLFEVSRGLSPREISRQLEEKQVISDADDFRFLGRLLGKWGGLKAGEYMVSSKMSPLQILDVLVSGISYGRPLTVREGENIYEIAKKLDLLRPSSGVEFLKVVKDPAVVSALDPSAKTLEGYLFPDTYSITRTLTVPEIVRTMTKRFESVWEPGWTDRARQMGFTRHQILTLASIIEKETGAPEERPLIASVFHNRLRKRMRLQSDPTTIYGIWERYDGNIRRSDLLNPTPYNTYTVPALPVGPIGNPGKESIKAALDPAQSTYLFFVSRNDGTHEFTSTLEEHNAAVRKFQLNAAARKGKSWRDLSKRQQAGESAGAHH